MIYEPAWQRLPWKRLECDMSLAYHHPYTARSSSSIFWPTATGDFASSYIPPSSSAAAAASSSSSSSASS
eukprot:747828-Hanusia_phi.AAC.2